MSPLNLWPPAARRRITGIFTDIDDTLTHDGHIAPEALRALGDLKAAGLTVIPITGRPIGWCEPFMAGTNGPAWPVDAMVAENGAVAFVPGPADAVTSKIGLQRTSDMRKALSKRYQQSAEVRTANRLRMDTIAAQVCAEVQRVLALLQSHGMQTTVSSIHIHGCFGDFNKWTGACWNRAFTNRKFNHMNPSIAPVLDYPKWLVC